jgi:signal transduction histidine kinase
MLTRWRLELGLPLAIGIVAFVAAGWTGQDQPLLTRLLIVLSMAMLVRIGATLCFHLPDDFGEEGRAPDLPPSRYVRSTGSLSRRMIFVAAAWILLLLAGGGYALDRVLTSAVTRNFEDQLNYILTALVVSAEIGPDGEVVLNRELTDQRFFEPGSGAYWQISGKGYPAFPSRSLWDRLLRVSPTHSDVGVHFYNSDEFGSDEKLLVAERDVMLPNSKVRWRFQVAQTRATLDAQIDVLRRTLVRSFLLLGFGLLVMAALQTWYGLLPLRAVRAALARVRAGHERRIEGAMPAEVAPMVEEINALVEHNDKQAEEARTHAGNLAHALKTPLTVIMNAAAAGSDDLAATVIREARTMRRQVDHHLARARAVGRRGSAHSRAEVWPSVEAVERAVSRLYPNVRLDITGPTDLVAHIERQDLDEMLGNLVENAAKYGGGSVFVTVSAESGFVQILIEDDGRGIPEADRVRIFDRGVRLDSGKPGTGLGLAIVRDVVEIYDGTIALEESEDLGGLLVRLRLPMAG